jgi:protein-serine/threonine kinase
MPTLKSPAHPGGNSHFNQKLKNFFRINTHNGVSDKEKLPESSLKSSDSRSGLRQPKRFFTVGRLRSTTTASEGNPLDDVMSPTASANPYFVHQGQPGLRHHETSSVPPSPPDTPSFRIDGPGGGAKEHATNATKEELARKLRRVASAPNAQGLFNQSKGDGERPATAELGKEPLVQIGNASSLGLVDSKASPLGGDAMTLSVPDRDGLSALPPPSQNTLAFRRTYSSNSIKVRTVEVGPASFDKIKMIGKGDVGKVYLVREKKSARLYAMKGQPPDIRSSPLYTDIDPV